ncbi:MAG TPA: alpha/beta fold hydrolase [Longimicrobiales bacterium]|nr:alpha/beta fold hydrolase [Longimicrobiales bacterium]
MNNLSFCHALLAVTMLTMGAAPGAAQDRFSGNWKGHWSRAGDSMLITMRVQRDTTGKYLATFDSERLRVTGIPFAEARVQGCCEVSLVLRGDRTTLTFNGTLRGDSLVGAFREGTSAGNFAYARVLETAPPFDERPISFTNGAVKLAGSLLLPRAGASLPAVVFVHGSGAEGRWASRFLASQLAMGGTAAFIFDKRGVGESSGDWRNATLDDLAGDVAAAVARLRQEPRIDAKRIGLHGHSQGGTLAPFMAARSSGVAFIIASAAAGIPMDSTEIFSVLNAIYPRATARSDSADARAYVHELVSVAYHDQPRIRLDSLAQLHSAKSWFFAPPAASSGYWSFSRLFATYQPLEWWAGLKVPVLLIYGAADERVPAAESAARISGTLQRAGNSDVTVRIFPGADHTFRLPPGPSDWSETAPGYLSTIMQWLAQR